MRSSLRTRLLAVITGLVLAVTSFVAAGAQGPDPDLSLADGLQPSDSIQAAKAPSSALAQTDETLLGSDDTEPVDVVIKLDYDAAATYGGTVPGLAATSPAVTGRRLTGRSAAERAYDRYALAQESAAVAEIERRVPRAEIGGSLRIVYGGVAASIPANTVEEVLAIPGVVAVQRDTLNQPLTDSTPDFINAPPVYSALGGASNAGAGVIYGNLDSGVWPEHPSFADLGNLATPPTAPSGLPRACDFGDNPLTPAADPFVCQDKLIGGQPFLTTYLSSPARAAAEPFHTARDSNGHGTHTASTSAGNMVASAQIFGVERGPVQGIAPGAWVMEYKVCGILGCFGSDTSAAVQQAILDGVDVINYSISGGTDPFTDPTELAFLDAYAAGVFVSASAGNSGPTASTANHLSPWVTTVAASTQSRRFQSTLNLSGSTGTLELVGASIAGAGISTALPVVMASAPPYSNALCTAAAPPGIFTGKIVACERGPGRIQKSFNVLQGGAAGMILYNATPTDALTDNHWIPTVHLADGAAFLAYMAANPTATATITAAVALMGQGDTMTSFSSRGPAGLFLKPDVTAPGAQILAGQTPVLEAVSGGPAGEYFQSIAGTSMSSPHTAGAALLLAALRSDWTPGQIKSALMTTAIEDLLKHDLVTPADPHDLGSGRIDVGTAATAGVTIDETAANFFAMAGDPVNAVHLNLPSINAPVVAGELTTTRFFHNPNRESFEYDVTATTTGGGTISVWPNRLRVHSGQSRPLDITITTTEDSGSFFGRVQLTPRGDSPGVPLHLPVAFTAAQGDVTLTSSCDAEVLDRGDTTTCEVTATNEGTADATVDLTTRVSNHLQVTGVTGATLTDPRRIDLGPVQVAAPAPGVPSVDPGPTPAGFLPLSVFGITPIPIGDEQFLIFNVPSYVFNSTTYTAISINSNGYSVAGVATSQDNNCCNLPTGPSAARPNNLLAPFWTDLDGLGAPGISVATLTDGVSTWLVVEHHLNVWGTTSRRHFQTWIGVNGVQDISFTYNPAALPGDPNGQDYLVGAENSVGLGDVSRFLPTQDLVVTSTPPADPGTVSYEFDVLGRRLGDGSVTTYMTASNVPGITRVETGIKVVNP